MDHTHHHHHHHAPIDVPAPVELTGDEILVELDAREVEWEYAPGQSVPGYGLNGQAPGPVIEAKKDVPLAIRLTNNLPEPTIIHWHGLRVPSAMDGTDDVQHPVQPGETFTYRFTPPDAGTFWYHSHFSEVGS